MTKAAASSTVLLPFGWLLGLLFIALKLTGQIAWSWWLVTMPIWLGWAVIAGVILGLGFLALVAKAMD
jgi:hypothetical protein